MKKLKKTLLLGLGTLSLVALSGCGISTKENFIVEFTYTADDGSEIKKQITADDVYERYLNMNPKDHAKAYYDAIQEIVIRASFEDENGKMHQYLDEMKREADKEVTKAKDEADNANKSWEDYLNDNGYDDEELNVDQKQHQFWLDKELAKMKEKVDDEYYDTFKVWDSSKISTEETEEQMKYNLVFGDNGYINSKLPYLVKHILVKIGDSTDNFTKSSVDSSSIEKLYRVIVDLTNIGTSDTTFGSIAKTESDDPGITDNPDGYLMDSSTGFVNEFKLGVYTYETLLTESASATLAKYNSLDNKKAFNIPGYKADGTHEAEAKSLQDLGATFIPYGALEELYEYKDITTTRDGKTVNEGNSQYYPRNIIFNKYFNRHNVAFITPEHVSDIYATGTPVRTFEYTDGTVGNSDLDSNNLYQVGAEYAASEGLNLSNFKEITFANGVTKKVLCDENGNPIMLALNASSSGGIHMIVVERSALIDSQKEYIDDSIARDVSLYEFYAPVNPLVQNGFNYETEQKYYNVEFPGVEKLENGKLSDPKLTYVYTKNEKDLTGYSKVVDSLKTQYVNYNSSIKSFLINEWLQNNSTQKIEAKDEKVKELIDTYKQQVLISNERSAQDSLKSAWESYVNTLEKQEYERSNGLILETCALHFGEEAYYGKGKLCYYSSSMNQN